MQRRRRFVRGGARLWASLAAAFCLAAIGPTHTSDGLSSSAKVSRGGSGGGGGGGYNRSSASGPPTPGPFRPVGGTAASADAANNAAVSPLSLTFDELSEALGGTGKAKACWDCFRIGVDPVWYYSNQIDGDEGNPREPIQINGASPRDSGPPPLEGWDHRQVQERMAETSSRRDLNGLGRKTLQEFRRTFGSHVGEGGDGWSVETGVAALSKITTCGDGTTKLLLRLASDGLEVEAVVIPWPERGTSTVCVSSQVGCMQACTFCSTGRMGKLRSLTSAEILAQLYWANKVCRLRALPPVDNCVFMGMGEPADNAAEVVRAARAMTDRNQFRLPPRRVTISTVAPSPGAFSDLAAAPAVLAWSVHSSRDEVRRRLVPTTRHSMEELRDGLVTTLQDRPKRLRNVMLEVTLLDRVNDCSVDDAAHLAAFCRPLLEGVDGIKLVVNLIPWNDIRAASGPASLYRPPSNDRVVAYQRALVERGILCYVRTRRGDEEDAACGMLATGNGRTKTKDS